MDDNIHRENGRHKPDHYKGNHAQWMMSQHQMKDHSTFKIMAAMAERDSAIQQRDIALAEKKAAIAERDMAILERDAAIAERNNAIVERDSVIGALRYARENANLNGNPMFSQGFAAPRAISKQSNPNQHHTSHMTQSPLLFDPPYASNAREMHVNEASPISTMPENGAKPRRSKHLRKDNKVQTVPLKKPAKTSRKNKKTAEDLNKQLAIVKSPWRTQEVFSNSGSEDLNKVEEWRGQELGLNLVTFDKTTMPVPGCSCTGILRQCYKWGSGGWQSSCCTTTISMYPLPVMPNKRHARVGGRKMSGSAFAKLLSRLAREGHDLSTPLDLKDHWAKHGTNRYITVK